MTMPLFGIVLGLEPSRGAGFYRVRPSIDEPDMVGVSLKGTDLAVGQLVSVIQHGGWQDSRRAFAFAETNRNIFSSIELERSRNSLIDQAPIGAMLAWLRHKGGGAEELYHPGRVTAVGVSSLTVSDWYTGSSLGSWPLASDLDIGDFSIGDGVLLRMVPETLRRVEGWWETVPSSSLVFPGWRLNGYFEETPPITAQGQCQAYIDDETAATRQYYPIDPLTEFGINFINVLHSDVKIQCPEMTVIVSSPSVYNIVVSSSITLKKYDYVPDDDIGQIILSPHSLSASDLVYLGETSGFSATITDRHYLILLPRIYTKPASMWT